ncbi:putative equilibrative nucleoside transporter [Helianthus annuus]|nr:putative equilibrative nucleoside transporter [Helianthus annuus]KAJ0743337.1 putative equilibrative nucleoside transporter [Helianthus annuus]KAJ0878506.1 putative equilibrative nucleoside transporter [Helianthus annuus]KAJ0882744.1 putative equilibrative nucleoside transporter [Helianthus annuus]
MATSEDNQIHSHIQTTSTSSQRWSTAAQMEPIHFLLGAGYVIPWNAYITAVDYFQYLYPTKHINKVFSVGYMSATVAALLTFMCWSTSSRIKLPSVRTRMNIGQGFFISVRMACLTRLHSCRHNSRWYISRAFRRCRRSMSRPWSFRSHDSCVDHPWHLSSHDMLGPVVPYHISGYVATLTG